jgi:hypothetical protein
MDPFTYKTTTLMQDTAGDFVNSGSFGAVDTKKGVYYTLMQPKGASGIHLASFDIAKKQKKIVPMKTTIAFGEFVDGSIIGCDEDESGVYFAIVNPTTGEDIFKRNFGQNYSFGSGAGAVTIDEANHIAYFSMSPRHAPYNVFHLFALNTKTGADVRAPLVMSPTPDTQVGLHPSAICFLRSILLTLSHTISFLPTTRCFLSHTQGPAGLTYIGDNKIMALMPPVGGAWEVVVIDVLTGKISPTTALKDVPPQHGRGSGASWLLKEPLPPSGSRVLKSNKDGVGNGQGQGNAKSGLVLSMALFEEMGTAERMIGIDVACALSTVSMSAADAAGTNCTVSNKLWSGTGPDLEDIGVYA